jgi:cell division GTPase FtsZ
MDVNRVSEVVTSLADPSANIIFGAVVDERSAHHQSLLLHALHAILSVYDRACRAYADYCRHAAGPTC